MRRVIALGLAGGLALLTIQACEVDGSGITDGSTSDGGDDAVARLTAIEAMCTTKTSNSATPFSAADFCALYLSACGGETFTGMLTAASCEATYGGWANKKVIESTDAVQGCASYHVCFAASDPATHCQHAAATSLCTPGS